ncbi:hypothetical protein [Pseudomonas corrugata]|uniref:hypothetical protein n=1 Tax=Pseudomonas corrugata TaxID=47879 RepID=UPI0004BC5E17|nr:hypothetical protein [Pseudomonas corrugata]
MQAIIKYEYLLSPAFGSDADMLRLSSELEMLSEHIDIGNDAPMIEDDTIGRMIEAGLYPSTDLFQERLSKLPKGFPYCAHDIVHMVNRIVQRGRCASDIASSLDVEWQVKSLAPHFVNVLAQRALEMNVLYEKIAISNYLEKADYSTLYHCSRNINIFQRVSFQGIALDIYPENGYTFPLSITTDARIFHSYKKYLSEKDGESLFSNSDEESIKRAFYVGALNPESVSGGTLTAKPWRDFDIGTSFYRSLVECECAPGMNFSTVLFDTVAHILAGAPKSSLDVFTKSRDSDEPRTHGKLIAYRTHVTTGNRALRLMYWQAPSGVIIFANVGNKFDLKISPP